LERTREGGLTSGEQAEWDEIARLEHPVRMAKSPARGNLKAADQAA
jgi:hypothetical protein